MPLDEFKSLADAQRVRKEYVSLLKVANSDKYARLAREGIERCDKQIALLGQMQLEFKEGNKS